MHDIIVPTPTPTKDPVHTNPTIAATDTIDMSDNNRILPYPILTRLTNA